MHRNVQWAHRPTSASIRVALVGCLVAAGGCGDDSPTGIQSKAKAPPRAPAYDVVSVTLGAAPNTAPPDYGMPQPIKINYRILPGQTVRIRATSALQLRANPNCPYEGDPYLLPVTVDPNGWWGWEWAPPPGRAEQWNTNGFWNLRAILVDSTVTVTQPPFAGSEAWRNGIQNWTGTPGTQAAGPWLRYASNTYDDRSLYAWAARTGEVISCGDGNPAGYLTSGSQTISVEPVLFNVTASKQVFRAGETVNFAVETELTAAGVTWTFLYTAGGSLALPSCSGQLTCAVAPTGSGRMDVQLLESATRLYVTTRSAEVKLTSTTESLIVTCGPPTSTTGGPVIRGQPVKCTAKTSSGKAFTVKSAALFGDDLLSDGLVGVAGAAVNKGKGWETDVGPAVFSGNLLMTAEFQQGSQVLPLAGSGRLEVTQRTAPFFQPTFAGGVPSTDSFGAIGDTLTRFFPFVVAGVDFRFGLITPIEVDMNALAAISIIPVTTGPFKSLNRALLAAAASLPLKAPRVFVHPMFSKDTTIDVYADQDGTDDGVRSRDDTGLAFCDNSVNTDWADRLHAFVARHEGVGGATDSHYGIYTSQFAALTRFDALERLTIPIGTAPNELKQLVANEFQVWRRKPEVRAPHRSIDLRDGQVSALNAAAGCALDFDVFTEFRRIR